MSDKDKIRQEIERRKGYISVTHFAEELLSFIDSLPGEIPPYITGFKGDPDPPGISDLEQEAARYERENRQSILSSVDIVNAFIDGAKWMESQMPMPEDTVIFQKGVEEGKRLMMEDAVDGEIGYWNQHGLSIRLDQSLVKLGYDMDTKVKIIIVKQ